ncbi:unnamed protein product, partial [Laminaria digitata]
KNASLLVWKPLLFVLVLVWVFKNMARRFPKPGDFYSVSPGFPVEAVCQGIYLLMASLGEGVVSGAVGCRPITFDPGVRRANQRPAPSELDGNALCGGRVESRFIWEK